MNPDPGHADGCPSAPFSNDNYPDKESTMNELRERLAAFGVSVLTDAEVVALTLGARADPDLGLRVLEAVGTPHGLLSRRMSELACICHGLR